MRRTALSAVPCCGRQRRAWCSEGQELTEHTSTQHALVEILSGECEFSLTGKPHNLKTGDFLNMPPNLAHAVKATKPFSMLLTLLKPA